MTESRGTILIVDDEESIREGISAKLRLEGFSCVTAADGKKALETASTQDFDIVLLDVKMPGMSGLDVLPRIVTDYPDTAVIMLSAMVDTESAVEAMRLGAYDYITKPVALTTLTTRLEETL